MSFPTRRVLRTRFRTVCVLGPLLLAALALPASAALPEPVARVAAALGVPADGISLWVRELGEKEPLAVHLPDVPRTPASTLKLLPTFAALQGLNPAYRWRTEAWALGPVSDGVLAGDLLLRGRGDPFLVLEEFWKLVRELRRGGLRRIEGDLVIDGSYFALPQESPGAFDNKPDRLYNLVPHALLVNFTAVRFGFAPAGLRVRVTIDPELDGLAVENRLRAGRGGCAGYQRGIALHVVDAPARDRVTLDGRFPDGCDRYAMTRSVLQPESYAYALFRQLWEQQGGELAGGWRRGTLPPALAAAVDALHEHEEPSSREFEALRHVHLSRPLGDLVRLVNKYSNNVMTRHLQLTLGAERYGAPATPEKGRDATLELLAAHGVDTAGLVLDNPSGLTRDARVTARQMGVLLQAAWDAPYMPEFVASLSLAGLDGTLRRRFRGASESGRMHLKTGTLDDVSAVAGYVESDDGRRLAVVLLVNAPLAHRGPGKELQDALLGWAFRGAH